MIRENTRKRPDIGELRDGVLRGDRRLLAKAISLVESTRPDDFHRAQELIELLLPHTGTSRRIGITGVPGVGKSTFIDAFGMRYLAEEHRVAVLAVDPSSGRSGGSILGDKTRMVRLSREANAFIRPSPSSGSLGGVARKTRETILLCEAAGFDTILVETVGVGQSETAVAGMVDFFLVLMLANAGDDLQGIKRGIMEMADAIVINKADGEQLRATRLARAHLRSALHLLTPKFADWIVPVLTCSALEQTGLEEIQKVLDDFFCRTEAIRHYRALQERDWLHALLAEELRSLLNRNTAVQRLLPDMEQAVVERRRSPAAAAHLLLETFLEELPKTSRSANRVDTTEQAAGTSIQERRGGATGDRGAGA